MLWDRAGRARRRHLDDRSAQLGRRDAPYIYSRRAPRREIQRDARSTLRPSPSFHRLLLRGPDRDRRPGGAPRVPAPPRAARARSSPTCASCSSRCGARISAIRFSPSSCPPLEPDGTSHLWEAIGRRFTGMSYGEADRLSKRNKEFMRRTFSRTASTRPCSSEDAQRVIGKVGAQTRGRREAAAPHRLPLRRSASTPSTAVHTSSRPPQITLVRAAKSSSAGDDRACRLRNGGCSDALAARPYFRPPFSSPKR